MVPVKLVELNYKGFQVKAPRKTESIGFACFDMLSALLEQVNDALFELNTWVVGSGAVFLLVHFRILLKSTL